MSRNISTASLLSLAFICLLLICASSRAGSGATASEEQYSVNVPPLFQAGFGVLREAYDLRNWPQTDTLRAAPPVSTMSKGLLTRADLDAQESRVSPRFGPFTDETWVGCEGTWNWSHHIVDPTASSLELPPNEQAALLESLRPDERDDPNLVQEILDKARDRYRMHQARRFAGQIRVKLCVAPSSQAAYEYLMLQNCTSSLPISALAADSSPGARLEGIGTLAFFTSGCLMFVRDNIAVMIDGRGDLAKETLPLARKIDSLILQQPVLSQEELMARAPSLTISANVRTNPSGQRIVPFEVSPAPERQIIGVWAYAGTENVQIKDSEVVLGSRVGKTTIKVSAISDELLVGTREIEVEMPSD